MQLFFQNIVDSEILNMRPVQNVMLRNTHMFGHNNCTAFHVQICGKLTNDQHRFVQISYA